MNTFHVDYNYIRNIIPITQPISKYPITRNVEFISGNNCILSLLAKPKKNIIIKNKKSKLN